MPRHDDARSIRRASSGFTLIEMLVAIAVTMIMMLAVVQVFQILGNSLDKGRAVIEMSGQLRNVTHRLQQDLDGVTCRTPAWTPADAGDGYLEYLELGGADSTAATTMWGDCPSTAGSVGDVLMFTARSKGRPFVGRNGGGTIESDLAEIIWWVRWDDTNADTVRNPEEVSIYRRVLLITSNATITGGSVATFLESNDVSVRVSSAGGLVANSLADLTLRQNRTFHNTSFPHMMNTADLIPIPSTNTDWGNDVVLSGVVGFDVRVWDPMAPVRDGTSVALSPGDPGWAAATTVLGRGAYVDLNYAGNNTIGFYSGPPNTKSQITTPTYSTWPFFYERDGNDQDGDSIADEGTDGFDTAGGLTTAADDPGEWETAPPYPHPFAGMNPPALRSIQVRIRIVEPGSRQVRQGTVVADFLPE